MVHLCCDLLYSPVDSGGIGYVGQPQCGYFNKFVDVHVISMLLSIFLTVIVDVLPE